MKIDLFSIGKFTIHGYGLMIAIGILCCVAMASYRAKKNGLDQEAIVDIGIYGVIGGFLGAKILYVIVEFKTFIKDPKTVLGSDGFVVYGGIIAGFLTAIVYCRIKKLYFLEYFDLAVASISMAQGFGRIGCFLAGCCYGRETTSRFVLLLYYRKNKKDGTPGNVGFLYMLLYGVGRFLVEFLRNDNRGGAWMFSTSQWISMVIVAGGIVLYLVNKKRHKW